MNASENPILTLLFYSTLTLTSLAFIGHVDQNKSKLLIDSTSLGISLISVIGNAVIYGLSTATETLTSQAYGAKNYKRVGIILQRSVLICSLALFPVIVFFLNAESIFLILDQSPCVARLTGKFCKIIAVALPALYLEVLLVRYLQSQGIVKPLIVVGILGNIANAVGLTLLLYIVELEVEGVAIALAFAIYTLLVSVLVYMFLRKPANATWHGFSWESLEEWKEFLWLAIPGLFMVCAEWWAFEIGSFVTGSINELQLATYTIALNLTSAGNQVAYGIAIAAGIRVGNMLGAGRPDRAKKAAIVAFCFAALWSLLVMIICLSYRNMGEIFTSDKDVVEAITVVDYLLSVLVYSDSFQSVLGGVLRGCGKHLPVAATTICSYYLLGLPVSLALVYAADMGALGFWIGATVGSVSQLLLVSLLLLRTDFNHESQKAMINAGVTSTENNKLKSTRLVDDVMSLLSDEEKKIDNEENSNESIETSCRPSPIRLILIRTPWYIIGLVVLVTGVVLSQYHIHLPYKAECDDTYNDNFTNSTTTHPITNDSVNYTTLYF